MKTDSAPERERRVRVLLASLDDYIPNPGTAFRSSSGPAPSRNVPCPDCLKSGRVRMTVAGKVVGERACPVCGGTGWRRRAKGEEEWDEYVDEKVGGVDTKPKRLRVLSLRELDAEVAKLERAERQRRGERVAEEYGWERERRRMEREGSYRELRRALEVLRCRYPALWNAVAVDQFYSLDSELLERRERQSELAVKFLSREMPAEIRIPSWAEQRQAERKAVGVAELHAAGLKPGQIAKVLRIPKEKVKRVLKGILCNER